jgi:hypothetical protein
MVSEQKVWSSSNFVSVILFSFQLNILCAMPHLYIKERELLQLGDLIKIKLFSTLPTIFSIQTPTIRV